jgi:hypothetical protein
MICIKFRQTPLKSIASLPYEELSGEGHFIAARQRSSEAGLGDARPLAVLTNAFKALPVHEECDEPLAEDDGPRNLNEWLIGH